MNKTLFEKIWETHVVETLPDGTDLLYIDRLYCHEVTSPQAFGGIRARGLTPFRPQRIVCMPDHNVPTTAQDRPVADPVSRKQLEELENNAALYGLEYFGLMHPRNGIIHVVGPETGLTLPGMTIVCGDSHTSTHGAVGAIAFGVGTSEVEMTLATQTILQRRPMTMRITFSGVRGKGVTAKDVGLYMISVLGTDGATGYFVEYSGKAITGMSMEERLTLCNLSIEMGARGGMIAPDEVTFEYLNGKDYSPKGEKWDAAIAYWKTLRSDGGAVFDREVTIDVSRIEPMVTYGTSPGMAVGITGNIPLSGVEADMDEASFGKALDYMGFRPGAKMTGTPVDYVFLGSCTNGRIEDFRAFASVVEGRRKAAGVTALLVPGSRAVLEQIRSEGIDNILEEGGFEIRQPGCSACLGMNEDRIPEGKYALSTTNRNFEGRQGQGARTILCSPLSAAAAAVTGVISDPRDLTE